MMMIIILYLLVLGKKASERALVYEAVKNSVFESMEWIIWIVGCEIEMFIAVSCACFARS